MKLSTDATIDLLLRDLSEPQLSAVQHTDGPLLILAGPGSGKTRVVTRRAAYIAATVTDPHHILAITFTNKGAREMRERIEALGMLGGMSVCTFHALCARLLREYHDRAGLPRNFSIVDRDDRRKLLKKAIEACNLESDRWRPAVVEAAIGRAKNDMMTAADFASQPLDWWNNTVSRIYTCYEEHLTEMAGLDFDDLLLRTAKLLGTDDELCDRLQDRYRYVLIDEYQDTNAAQYTMARLLSRKRENICATGDPDQSIYGWRGANIENILTFERDYPAAKVVRLEQNYRSTKHILAAADALISKNLQRKEKTLWTENDEGASVRIVECEQGDDEANAIARDVTAQLRNGLRADDIAVFYRINSLSRGIEEAFIREGIKYQIARGVEFYGRKEIKDVLAYLRVLVNNADEISLLRAINTPPRGIGATTVRRLVEHARTTGRRVYDLITGDEDLSGLGRSAGKVRQFGELLRSLSEVIEQPAPKALEYVISHSGLRALYGAEGDADDAPGANLDELISAAAAFHHEQPETNLVDWLEHTALVSDVDSVKDDSGMVTLMTLHSAKGLEFSAVYIIGLEDGLLPFTRHDDEEADEEEERRLCFVGITRAKQRLTLSHVRYRMLRGITQRTSRSRFLDELPDNQIECVSDASGRPRRRAWQKAKVGDQVPAGSLPDDIGEWQVGSLVRHPLHGLGQIMSLNRGARRTHVDVAFKDGSRKSWVLEFAHLERVDFDDVD